ncbi:MAG: hypothetical protein JXM70_14075 [Pirellulales bacterium]|nr:hypothetical protein [Pirellulales bacterium]
MYRLMIAVTVALFIASALPAGDSAQTGQADEVKLLQAEVNMLRATVKARDEQIDTLKQENEQLSKTNERLRKVNRQLAQKAQDLYDKLKGANGEQPKPTLTQTINKDSREAMKTAVENAKQNPDDKVYKMADLNAELEKAGAKKGKTYTTFDTLAIQSVANTWIGRKIEGDWIITGSASSTHNVDGKDYLAFRTTLHDSPLGWGFVYVPKDYATPENLEELRRNPQSTRIGRIQGLSIKSIQIILLPENNNTSEPTTQPQSVFRDP